MKDNVEIYTMALVRVIHDSEVYKEYQAVKEKAAEDPELKRQINQYRKECYQLQNSGEAETLYERTRKFDEQYKELLKNPLAEAYIQCELAICRMLQQITGKVMEAVDLDLDGIAEELHLGNG